MRRPSRRVQRIESIIRLFAPAALASSCEEHHLPEIDAPVYEGDDLDIWASDGLQACAGTFGYLEGWLGAFRRHVGAHASLRHHRYYWVSEADGERNPCLDHPPHSSSCAFVRSATIYSPLLPFEHELVHSEFDPFPSHPLLSEGAAEIFGSIAASGTAEELSIEQIDDGGYLDSRGYAPAGRFSRYLTETFGEAAYFELLDNAADSDDEASLSMAFRQTLGVALDDAIADYETYPPCDPTRWRYHDYECHDLAVTAWESEGVWRDTFALDCAAPDVIGPRPDLGSDAPPKIWTLRALEIAKDGAYQLRIESEAPAMAELHPCDGNCFDDDGVTIPPVRAATDAPSAVSLLLAGRYWLRVERMVGNNGEVVVSVEHDI